jgi:hypothetical protein
VEPFKRVQNPFLISASAKNAKTFQKLQLKERMSLLLDRDMNFSFETRELMCEAAVAFRSDRKFLLILFAESALSFLTLCLMWQIGTSRECRRIWSLIGRDLKVGFVFWVNFGNYWSDFGV